MKEKLPPVAENHVISGWDDRSFVEILHYNEHGLNHAYTWERVFMKPTPNNEDMELARTEACKAFINLGGHVIISIMDSMAIPENDRNAPRDMREGHEQVLGEDWYGFPIIAKKKTGNPGDKYYDWKPMDDVEKRICQIKYLLKKEKHEKHRA